MTNAPTHSLFELNEYVRRVLALNFPESIWVRAEIAQMNLNRGIHYLDLVEKNTENNEVIAQSSAILWKSDWENIRRQQGDLLDELWREGVELRLRVWVEFHERYGLRLLIKEVDTAFTLGQLELQRRAVLQKLKIGGFLEKNRMQKLPAVAQRIAVITAQTAAGWQDFRQHLASNGAGFRFHLTVFNCAVQGKNAEAEIIAALEKIDSIAEKFDCIAIIRGGGARLDLAAFDQFELCKKLATAKLPVITGIGHDVDESVADLVAFSAQKTPTAAADFLMGHNLLFEGSIELKVGQIAGLVSQKTHLEKMKMEAVRREIFYLSKEKIGRSAEFIGRAELNLPVATARFFERKHVFLENAATVSAALDPARLLARGFSMTFLGEKLVKSVGGLKKGDVLRTVYSDGETQSELK